VYDAVADPYCYPGTTVLINKLDLREQTALDEFEAEISRERAAEPLPAGQFDVAHYEAIHHHLFQDVYDWAGEIRNVRISKDGSMFCFPEHIDKELAKLFAGLQEQSFSAVRTRSCLQRKPQPSLPISTPSIRFARATDAHSSRS
jgi:cell filamentation protein